jgi:hypothetical protein
MNPAKWELHVVAMNLSIFAAAGTCQNPAEALARGGSSGINKYSK